MLPDQQWQLEYDIVHAVDKEEFQQRINQGWRRFGDMLFRPQCPSCTACQPIRIPVDRYQPNRSQKRVRKANAGTVLKVQDPVLEYDRLMLYLKHHLHHAKQKGWPTPDPEGSAKSIHQIISGSLPVKEWAFYHDEKLVGILYVDVLPEGYSGIYSYYDPDYRHLSLGTFMCMAMIDEAVKHALPYVFLGYYVKGCRSMEYKGKFAPNQILVGDNVWVDFLE